MRNIFFTFVSLCLLMRICAGLRCYTCSYDEKDWNSDFLCVTEPWNVTGNPFRTCMPHVKFCVIIRIESKEKGKLTSFLRKCEENPTEDSDVELTSVVAHYRSCTTNLCNGGDGLNFIDEGREIESVAILVPDRNLSTSVFPKNSLFALPLIWLFWSRKW